MGASQVPEGVFAVLLTARGEGGEMTKMQAERGKRKKKEKFGRRSIWKRNNGGEFGR